MNKSLPLLLMMFLLLTACASVSAREDPWFGKDKIVHFCASGLIAGVATAAAHTQDRNDSETFVIAMGMTLSLGAAKEAYDGYLGNSWSWKDLMWGALGGLAGYFIAAEK